MSIFYKFDKIAERDIDFVLMLLFGERALFLKLFTKNAEKAKIVRIEHSMTDTELGESDITVIYEQNDKKYGLLIEDKVAAIAMENQSERYIERGKKGVENGDYEYFSVCIVAPQHYLDTNLEAKKYENRISYEQIIDFVNSNEFHCKDFVLSLLKDAVTYEKSGYKMIENSAVTNFWNSMYEYICNNKVNVYMYEPNAPKGTRSTWIQFKIFLKNTALYYKTNYGYVDLEFKRQADNEKRIKQLLKKFIDTDMNWVITGKSLSLRIITHSVDVTKLFSMYEKIIPEVLEKIEKLANTANKINNDGILD